jgi:hypothetical protein
MLDRLVTVGGNINLGLSPVWRKEIDQVRVKKEARLILHVALFYTKSGVSYKFIRTRKYGLIDATIEQLFEAN